MDMDLTSSDGSELVNWISTYGLVTVEKMYQRYHINLKPDEIISVFRHADSVLFHLVQVPIKHVFNGLICQQAVDYQIYAQKLFVDFLLSGKANETGSPSVDNLEAARQELINAGELFQKVEVVHHKLIAESQAVILKCAQSLILDIAKASKKLQQAFKDKGLLIQDDKIMTRLIYVLMSDFDVKNQLSDQDPVWARVDRVVGQSFDISIRPLIREEILKLTQIQPEVAAQLADFRERATTISKQFKEFRGIFSALIVKTNELLYLMSDYHIDEAQQKLNQQEIDFNAKLGE